MNSKPLTYDSLKCVLEYVEANRRIEIARRCPSIRKVEKLVPLHLNELVFKDNGFKLNNIKYELGIHQKYHVGNIPDSIRQHNKLGGYTMDLDNFGLEDSRYLNVLTPGDILIKEKPWEENDLVIENRIRHVEELVRAFGDPVGIMPDEYERINELIFLKYLHENAPVPFENVFRLKISTFMGNETVEFYRYNMSYYQALKKLSMLLFGERSKPIGAKNLYIYQSHIIRLPPSLKIKNIVQMQIPCEAKAVCEAIPEMFEEPNLLLERMFIIDPQVEDLSIPIVQNAKYIKLCIQKEFYRRNREEDYLLQVFRSVTNLTAHFEMCSLEFPLEDLVTFLRHWKESGKQIGSLLFLMFEKKQLCMERFMDVAKQFEGARLIEEKIAIIPLSIDSEIELSWSQEREWSFWKDEWKLQMKVKAIDQ
ncbi:unnamed protein product [Caenorhabditis brenneri]